MKFYEGEDKTIRIIPCENSYNQFNHNVHDKCPMCEMQIPRRVRVIVVDIPTGMPKVWDISEELYKKIFQDTE